MMETATVPHMGRSAPSAPPFLLQPLIYDVSPVLHEGGQGVHAGRDGTDGETRRHARVGVEKHGLDDLQNIRVSEQTRSRQTPEPDATSAAALRAKICRRQRTAFSPRREHQQSASASRVSPALQEVRQKLLQLRRRETAGAAGARRVHRQPTGGG